MLTGVSMFLLLLCWYETYTSPFWGPTYELRWQCIPFVSCKGAIDREIHLAFGVAERRIPLSKDMIRAEDGIFSVYLQIRLLS